MMKKLIAKPYSEEGQKSEDKFYRHHYKQDRKWSLTVFQFIYNCPDRQVTKLILSASLIPKERIHKTPKYTLRT